MTQKRRNEIIAQVAKNLGISCQVAEGRINASAKKANCGFRKFWRMLDERIG